MTIFNSWKEFDPSSAAAGDIIIADRNPVYIQAIREIKKVDTANVIHQEYRLDFEEYSHQFESKSTPGAGYSFGCYQDGSLVNPDVLSWNDKQTNQQYFDSIKANPDNVYQGIERRTRTYFEPAVIRCKNRHWSKKAKKYIECDGEVVLNMVMTNTCDKCHADYSNSGTMLAPRSQWGWDTGESLSDILSADRSINEPRYEGDDL